MFLWRRERSRVQYIIVQYSNIWILLRVKYYLNSTRPLGQVTAPEPWTWPHHPRAPGRSPALSLQPWCCAHLPIWTFHCTALCCTILHCSALWCTILHCTLVCCTILYCTELYCTILYCTALYGPTKIDLLGTWQDSILFKNALRIVFAFSGLP